MNNLNTWLRGFGSRGPETSKRHELRLLFKRCAESLTELEQDYLLPPLLSLYVECYSTAPDSSIAESLGNAADLKRFVAIVAKKLKRTVQPLLEANAEPIDLLRALKIPESGNSPLLVLDVVTKGPSPVFEALGATKTISLLARVAKILPRASTVVGSPPSESSPAPPPASLPGPSTDTEPGAEATSEESLDPAAELQRVREFLEQRRGWGQKDLAPVEPGESSTSLVTVDTFSAVAQALFSLLRRCLSRPDTCAELEEPNNQGMVDLFSVALLEPTAGAPESVTQLELRWKQSAASLLEDVFRARLPHGPKLLQSVLRQRCFQLVLSSVTNGNPRSIKTNLDLLFLVFMESAVYLPVMLADFKAMGMYDSLKKEIIQAKDGAVQDVLIAFLERLVYIGAADLAESLGPEDEYHFQHADFKLPTDNGGPCVSNRDAFVCIVDAYLQASQEDAGSALTVVAGKLATTISNVIKGNPINYFILESTGFLLMLAEKLELLRPQSQKFVLDLFEFALVDLNFVPFKEMTCLCIHFTDTSTNLVTTTIAETLSSLASRSKKLGNVFRDVGLINMLGNMVRDMATTLRTLVIEYYKGASQPGPITMVEILDSSASGGPRRKPHPRFQPALLTNFEAMMSLAAKLLEGDVDSCSVWTKSAKGSLLDLLSVDELRRPALKVVRSIGMTRAAREGTLVSQEFDRDFVRLLEALLVAPPRSVAFKADVVDCFCELLVFSPKLKAAFRDNGGFVTSISILATLEDTFRHQPAFPIDVDLDVGASHGADFKPEDLVLARDLAPSSALIADHASAARLTTSVLLMIMEASKNDDAGRALLVTELESLTQALRISGILQSSFASGLMGTLFAMAVEDNSLQMLFVSNVWESTDDSEWSGFVDPSTRTGSAGFLVGVGTREPEIPTAASQQVNLLRNMMARSTRILRNPDVLVAILGLLTDLGGSSAPKLAYACLIAIHGLSLGNRGNQSRMSSAGMLLRLLDDLYGATGWLSRRPEAELIPGRPGPERLPDLCRDTARMLAMRLLELGVASDAELRYLFEEANPEAPWHRDNPLSLNDVADVILHGVKYGRTPSHIHFDHRSSSLSGVSMELAPNASVFPQNGWSFSLWMRVHDFDALGNVNLLSLQPDDKGSPVLNVFIEGQSRKVVVVAGKTQMRFENFALRPRKWYHMVIVHSRSRIAQLTSSSITLFIDGIIAEQAKCNYPVNPPRMKRAVFGIISEDMSSGPSQLVWDLGMSQLFADSLDPDSVNVIYNLGPQYRGNFQDSLKKYQTYEIIDSVNLDFVNHGHEDGTDLGHLALATAVVRCGGSPVTEEQIVFALSAASDVVEDVGKGPSATAAATSRPVLVNSAHPRDLRFVDWSMGSSAPGAASLYGNAIRINPNRLVDGIWKIGGCALIVRFIEGLSTPDLLFKGISILVESIRFNWRNTEDMEKEHLYEAFATVLRNKVDIISAEAVEQLLVLIGKLPNLPTEAVLANTMAYRFLFLDFELWRRANKDIQKLVLAQFQDFTVGSRKRVFNAKRLGKLFLTKRLLMALRTEVFAQSLLPDVVQVIRSTLIASFNVDSVRAIATFIMSTLPQSTDGYQSSGDDWAQRQRRASHSAAGSNTPLPTPGAPSGGEWPRRMRSASIMTPGGMAPVPAGRMTPSAEWRQRRGGGQTPGPDMEGGGDYFSAKRARLPSTLGITTESTRSASRYELYGPSLQVPQLVSNAEADEARFSMPQLVTEVRNLLLACLVDIVCCESGNNPFVSSFGQMITARWVLLFMEPKLNAQTAVLGARLLSKLLVSQGPSYVERFRSSSQGFVIMSSLIPRHWNLLEIHTSMLMLAFGIDPTDVPIHVPFDLATLCSVFKPDHQRLVSGVPEGLTMVLSMLREMVQLMSRQRSSMPVSRFLGGWAAPGGGLNTPESDDRLGTVREYGQLIEIYIGLFEKLYTSSNDIKALLTAPDAVEQLILIVFPIVCNSAILQPDAEIGALETAASGKGQQPGTAQTSLAAPVASTPASESPTPEFGELFPESSRAESEDWSRKRNVTVPEMWQLAGEQPSAPSSDLGSFDEAFDELAPLHAQDDSAGANSKAATDAQQATKIESIAKVTVDRIVDFIVFLCVDSVIGDWKPLLALENVMKGCPPSAAADQKRFRALVLSKILERLLNIFASAKATVLDARIQSNLSKLGSYVVDKLFQGWFAEYASLTVDLLAQVLETIEEVSTDGQRGPVKTDANVQGLYRSLNKAILFQLNEDRSDKPKLLALTAKCAYHQRVIFSSHNGDSEFYRCLISRLWKMLSGIDVDLQNEAISLWKLMLLQKPSEMAAILKSKNKKDDYAAFVEGFSKLLEMDSRPFLAWIAERKADLSLLFAESVESVWESFIFGAMRNTIELDQGSAAKRLNKLRRLSKKATAENSVLVKYQSKTQEWLKDVQDNEYLRYRRFAQDALDTQAFVLEEWAALSSEIHRQLSLWDASIFSSEPRVEPHQQLDFVEGPHRMRRKLRQSRHNAELDVLELTVIETPATTGLMGRPSVPPQKAASTRIAGTPKSSAAALDLLADTEDSKIDVAEARGAETGPGLSSGSSSPLTQESPTAEQIETEQEEGEDEEGEDDDDAIIPDEDKNRKVARLLEAGDTVLESYNAARVMGLDICEGLLLICKQNIYLIDNYTRRSDGELDDVANVLPEERNSYNVILANAASQHIPGKPRHTCRKWAYDNIKEVHKRKFLFRNVGLEIFLLDGRNFLVTLEPAERDAVYNRLLSKASIAAANKNETLLGPEDLSVGGKITSILFSGSSLTELTAKWERWEVSNFEYLMRLNTLAGRSYNDLTQFPVFPWVVADYSSNELDLAQRSTFRDLSKPMGAQTEDRALEFEERYRSWEDPDGRPAFHYGTHYSSSMIVCSFLIRMEPFTQLFLKLQGGHLDHADRLFHSIQHAWLSAAKLNTTDVRELMPEFYCNPEFLRNSNHYDFGLRQNGERINDVVLPPWAKGDPRYFVYKLRQALESSYVSQHLHEWIDLVFGFKQQGPDAAKSLNVFHYLSYEGAVDMDSITDSVEKQATIGIIHNFGQTPRQLFKKQHPARMLFSPVVAYKLYRQPQLLFQAPRPVLTINQVIKTIALLGERPAAFGPQRTLVPVRPGQAPSRYLDWGFVDGSVRIYQIDVERPVGVFESLHTGQVTCAQFADDKTLVVGGSDMVITIWHVQQDRHVDLDLLQVLRGHRSAISCLAVSRAYNMIVSGAVGDSHALVWDLSRLIYVRRLAHPEPVKVAVVNDVTGDILVASDLHVSVFTINGELLACRQVAYVAQDAVMAAVFFTGEGWADADVVVTGHRSGAIKVWKLNLIADASPIEGQPSSSHWSLDLATTLTPKGDVVRACTSVFVAPSQRFLLTGDAGGRVHAWLMPEGSGTEIQFANPNEATNCSSCGRGIGGMALLVDRRVNCTACGSVFCGDCITPHPLFPGRFCISCAERAQKSRPEL